METYGYQAMAFYKYDYVRGFKNYQHPLTFRQSSTAMLIEEDYAWLAYREHGFIKLDRKSNSIEEFNTAKDGKYNLPSNLIYEFFRLSNGKMAILGFPWLIILDEKSKTTKHIRLRGASRALYEDAEKKSLGRRFFRVGKIYLRRHQNWQNTHFRR